MAMGRATRKRKTTPRPERTQETTAGPPHTSALMVNRSRAARRARVAPGDRKPGMGLWDIGDMIMQRVAGR